VQLTRFNMPALATTPTPLPIMGRKQRHSRIVALGARGRVYRGADGTVVAALDACCGC